MSRAKWIGLVIAVIVAAVLATLLGACGGPTDANPLPVTCATWQDREQQWREEDGELVDSDPCDLDDLFENKVRTTAPAKPVPKASPAKPNVKSTKR